MSIRSCGLHAARHATGLGVAIGVEVLAEDDVVGNDKSVDTCRVEQAGPFEEAIPAAGVGGRKVEEPR